MAWCARPRLCLEPVGGIWQGVGGYETVFTQNQKPVFHQSQERLQRGSGGSAGGCVLQRLFARGDDGVRRGEQRGRGGGVVFGAGGRNRAGALLRARRGGIRAAWGPGGAAPAPEPDGELQCGGGDGG